MIVARAEVVCAVDDIRTGKDIKNNDIMGTTWCMNRCAGFPCGCF